MKKGILAAWKRVWIPAVVFWLLFGCGCGFQTGEEEYERGVAAYAKGSYREAAQYFEQALAKNEDRAEYYLYYGFTLTQLGEYDRAVQNFACVILDKEFESVKENNKRAYRGAGIAHYLAGEEEEALSCFYAALQIPLLEELDEDIRSYMVQVNAALLERYRGNGELARAREMCDGLLMDYGESADIFRMRADLWMEEGAYEAALADFDAAIAAGDGRMGTLLGKLMALQALGREQEAAEVSAAIAAMEPTSDEEALSGAIAAFSIGDYDVAAKSFLRLAEKGVLQAEYYLSQLYMAREAYGQALGSLRVLEQKGVDSAELYYQMAISLLKTGDTAGAVQYYRKLEEKADESYQRRQEKLYIVLLEEQGDYAGAYERLGQYLAAYVTEQDAEYAEAQKEYEFLRRVTE